MELGGFGVPYCTDGGRTTGIDGSGGVGTAAMEGGLGNTGIDGGGVGTIGMTGGAGTVTTGRGAFGTGIVGISHDEACVVLL